MNTFEINNYNESRAKLYISHAFDAIVFKAYNEWVEECDDDIDFESYIRHSTLLQINDKQIKTFMIKNCGKLGIINYDLYSKASPDRNIYGVIIPNVSDEKDKNSWRLISFLTADMIEWNFDIKSHELPLSSRQIGHFSKQLFRPHIDDDIIENINWSLVPQNKGIKKHFGISIELNNNLWIKICKDSLKNHNLSCIPIVAIKDNYHFVKWIQIIYDETERIYYNVAFKHINAVSLVYGYDREENVIMNVSNDVLNVVIKYCGDMIDACERDINLDDIRSGNKLLGSRSGLVLSDTSLNKYRRLSKEELCLNEDGSSGFAYPPYLLQNIKQ